MGAAVIRLRTPRDDGGVSLSTVVTVDDGARVALLHEPGAFRLDVEVREDTLRTRVRDLGGHGIAFADAGSPIPRFDAAPLPGDRRPVQLRVVFTVASDPPLEVRALVAVVRSATDGRAELTAQATARVAAVSR